MLVTLKNSLSGLNVNLEGNFQATTLWKKEIW